MSQQKWIVVGRTPILITLIDDNGQQVQTSVSHKHPPFVPVIDRVFTGYRKRGLVQPFRGVIAKDAPQATPAPPAPSEEKFEASAAVPEPTFEPLVEAEDEVVLIDEQGQPQDDEDDEIALADTALSERIVNTLANNNVKTLRELRDYADANMLKDLDGIGSKTLTEIMDFLSDK